VPEAQARRNLSQLLSHLRRALPEADLLQVEGDRVALDPTRTWSDTEAFESLSREEAAQLYRGPFLAGFSLPGSPEFESWGSLEGQAWERRYLEVLVALVEEGTARGEFDAAIGYARRYLEVDELAEDVHRRLISLYVATGDGAGAARQYERCAIVLERELGVSPLPQTRAAYRAAAEGEPALPRAGRAADPAWTTLPSLDAPLVGREAALATLELAHRAAQSGRGRAVLISGEPGIGKSRLLQEFVKALDGEIVLLVGSAHQAERAMPYWPLIEALSRQLERVNWTALDVSRAHLAEVARLLPGLRGRVPSLPAPQPEGALQQGHLFRALTHCLIGLASCRRPLILCVEDLHWADSATLTYLSYLLRHLPTAPALLLGSYRSYEGGAVAELRDAGLRSQSLEELRLQGLREEAVVDLLKHLSGNGRGATRYGGRLHRETGGNPFFLLEILRTMFEAGVLTEDEGGWRVALEEGGNDDLPLPKTVVAAIRERLAHLTPEALQVLEAGVVLGYHFEHDLVGQISGRPEGKVVAALELLLARHLIVEEAQGYHFAHDLIRSVVYGDLSYGRRRLLHRRAGEALEAWRPDDVEALAHHFQGAERLEKAIEYRYRAGERALRLAAPRDAVTHHSKALTLLEHLPDAAPRAAQELRLQLAFGVALGVARGYGAPRVGAAHRRARELAHRLSDVESLFAALGLLLMHHTTRGEQRIARGIGEELVAVAQQLGDAERILISRWQLGVQQLVVGELGAARENLAWVVAHYEPRKHHPLALRYGMEPGVMSRSALSLALWMLGEPELALEETRGALSLAQALAYPFGETMARVFACVVHGFRGEWEAVVELAEEVLEISSERGFHYWRTAGLVHLGQALVERGQVAEGIALLRRGIDEGQGTGAQMFMVVQLTMLAGAYAKAGELERALDAVGKALDVARETGERFGEPETHRLHGELLLRTGAPIEEARRSLSRALALAREQGARALEQRARESLERLPA
jgi:DNA-binding SARP family transcriptional activator/predicted ATPase